MSETQPESTGRHAAPDDDPNSDPPPVSGDGGEHRADGPAEEGDEEPESPQASEESDDGDSGESATPGVSSTRQPGADPEEEEEIEEERERRLDPENRPDNVEIDNTQRDFDVEKGMFTDSEGYEEAEEEFPPLGGQGA